MNTQKLKSILRKLPYMSIRAAFVLAVGHEVFDLIVAVHLHFYDWGSPLRFFVPLILLKFVLSLGALIGITGFAGWLVFKKYKTYRTFALCVCVFVLIAGSYRLYKVLRPAVIVATAPECVTRMYDYFDTYLSSDDPQGVIDEVRNALKHPIYFGGAGTAKYVFKKKYKGRTVDEMVIGIETYDMTWDAYDLHRKQHGDPTVSGENFITIRPSDLPFWRIYITLDKNANIIKTEKQVNIRR